MRRPRRSRSRPTWPRARPSRSGFASAPAPWRRHAPLLVDAARADRHPHARRARPARPTLLAAHCVHVDDEEIALLAEHDVAVAHCPRSNALLGCGVAPLAALLAAGVRVGLGTDSPASTPSFDMFEEMRAAVYSRARARSGPTPSLPSMRWNSLPLAQHARSISTTRSGRSPPGSAPTSRSSRSPARRTCPGRIQPQQWSSAERPSGCSSPSSTARIDTRKEDSNGKSFDATQEPHARRLLSESAASRRPDVLSQLGAGRSGSSSSSPSHSPSASSASASAPAAPASATTSRSSSTASPPPGTPRSTTRRRRSPRIRRTRRRSSTSPTRTRPRATCSRPSPRTSNTGR